MDFLNPESPCDSNHVVILSVVYNYKFHALISIRTIEEDFP